MKLYRFSKKEYLEDFVGGKVTFSHWRTFKDKMLTKAQQDNENERTHKPDLKRTAFSINGFPLTGLKDISVKRTSTLPDYYLLCFTIQFNEQLYKAFNADSCIQLSSLDIFKDRLHVILDKLGWEGRMSEVNYFDRQDPRVQFKNNLDILFKKDLEYQDQQEYRIVVWDRKTSKPDRITFELDDLRDICSFV